jgi:hypothetical protein
MKIRELINLFGMLGLVLEVLAVPTCVRFGHPDRCSVFALGGSGLLLSAVSRVWVRRSFALHIFGALCALYWMSGYVFFYAHTSGGSILVTHAQPTVINRCLTAFYRPWFIFLGFEMIWEAA